LGCSVYRAGPNRTPVSRSGQQVSQSAQVVDSSGEGKQPPTLSIPDAPALRPVSVTLEGWAAFDATDGIRTVFAKPVGIGSDNDSYGLGIQEEG
jgi:hypothetical protein